MYVMGSSVDWTSRIKVCDTEDETRGTSQSEMQREKIMNQQNKTTLRHITFKLQISKDTEKYLERSHEWKKYLSYRGTKRRTAADFSSETMQARKIVLKY